MTQESRIEFAKGLVEKGVMVLDGAYDPEDNPGDNLRWAGDLFSAAAKLVRLAPVSRLTQSELEEIESGCDLTDEELDELRGV